jgi:HK97 family phage portal protein
MRQEVELSNALQTFGTKYFENGTNLGGIVEHPGHLGKNARDHLKEDLDKNYTGLDHAQRTIILEEGMKYNKIGIPAEDSQFIQSRKFQLEEVCRYYGVQLHMIQNLDKASFNNIEQQSLEFRTYCMLPWATIWEQEIYKSCLTPEEQIQNYYARYNMNALLRADYSTRMNNYRTGVQMGLYSLNEVREMEDMNPIPGEGGNVHFVNSAMIDINTQLAVGQDTGTAQETIQSGVGGEDDAQ